MPLGLGRRCTTLAEELEKLLVEYVKLDVKERYFWYSVKESEQLQKEQKKVEMRNEEVRKAVGEAMSSSVVLRV